jgi:PAS domain S-box-containing protein
LIRVLCVDDEPYILDITKAFLEQSVDLRVEMTQSGYRAMELLREHVFDAVVSDYDMPEIDGIEFLKLVRHEIPDIPFLLFTGKGREEVVIEALNNGADFYIQKGGDVKAQFVELEHKIRQAVKKRHAEYALSVSERHERFLVNIIKHSTQAFVVSYPDGGLGLPNQAFCQLTGYTEMQLKDMNWTTDLTPPEWRELDHRIFQELEVSGVPQRYEREITRSDGSRVPVEVLVHVIKNPQGELQYFYSFINDISERRQAERTVKRTFGAMETSIDGMAIINANGECVYVNHAQARIYGYESPSDLIGKHWLIFYDANEGKKFLDEIIPTAKANGSWFGQVLGRRRDGCRFPQEVSLTYLDDGGLIGVTRDISDKERDKEALKRSQEELKSIFDNVLIGIYRTSPEGRIMMANPALARMLDYGSIEDMLANTDANSIYVDGGRDRILSTIEQQGFCMGMETAWRRRDGSSIYIRDSARAVRDDCGRTVYYEGTVEDITERRRAEEALKRANDKLTLLNSITRHDILNQLVVVQGYTDLLKTKDMKRQFTEYVVRIEKSLGTIKRQVEFTRDYQSMGVREPTWQNLHSVFKRASVGLDLNGLDVFTDGDNWEVFADPMFEKVFFNLLDNSLRHGGQVTRLSLETEERNGHLSLIYSDDGNGIPKEDKQKIFEMGFGKHTGLGLFLVKAILEITQCSIDEVGGDNDGARFVITVPTDCYRQPC